MAPEQSPRPTPRGLKDYWNKPLREFATLPVEPIEPGLAERHRLYSLLVMAIVASQWNGNRFGDRGDYGRWRERQLAADLPDGVRLYRGGSYLGHNIGALAVDARGNVIDYDFNHNEIFNSSVEHAESRLVRRLFSLAEIFTPWRQEGAAGRRESAVSSANAARAGRAAPSRPPAGSPSHPAVARRSRPTGSFLLAVSPPPEGVAVRRPSGRRGYGSLLTDVSVYTSLESCAQCSGIMTLADVREVAYLQYDQGQYLVGNMMFRATDRGAGGPRAPLPIPADAFGFDHYDRLNAGNIDFADRVTKEPFFRDGSNVISSPSVTLFLCTDGALGVYEDAAKALDGAVSIEHPTYRRPDRAGRQVPGALSNAEVLDEVKDFLGYVRSQGGRGTPHRV